MGTCPLLRWAHVWVCRAFRCAAELREDHASVQPTRADPLTFGLLERCFSSHKLLHHRKRNGGWPKGNHLDAVPPHQSHNVPSPSAMLLLLLVSGQLQSCDHTFSPPDTHPAAFYQELQSCKLVYPRSASITAHSATWASFGHSASLLSFSLL